MHRIIVVDDERNITDAIYHLLLRQEQWDVEVFRAYDGASAWAMMERSRFDLIISDICMPGLDGMLLARKVRMLWPSCQIIFLTGYQSFEYAYQALQLGDVRYILKTSDFSHLLDEVSHCLAFLSEEQARIRSQTLLEAQVAMAFSMFRNELCAQLVQGRIPLAELVRESGFDLDIKKDTLALLCFPRMPENEMVQDGHMAKLIVYTMHRLLLNKPVHWLYGTLEGAILCLFQVSCSEETEKQTLYMISNMIWAELSDLQTLIEQTTGTNPILLMSQDAVDVASLPLLYSEMKRFAAQPSAHGAIMRISARQPTMDAEGAVRRAMRYIYMHYADDISLLSLANEVHMNTAYLSRLFKKVTGKNVVDFVNSVRIDAACHLLRDTLMKVADIAVATGFGTPKYFHVVFRRYMDMTPVQWREQEQSKG